MNNREFSKKNEAFIKACEDAGIPPTQRQASKYRMGRGKAWANKPKSASS